MRYRCDPCECGGSSHCRTCNPGATIQAVDGWDEEGGTMYVLTHDDGTQTCAAWPQILLDLEPTARRIPASTGTVRRNGYTTMKATPRGGSNG